MPRVKESSCALCVVALKPFIVVMLYTSKDREKNIFFDNITFNTLSKTSDLL